MLRELPARDGRAKVGHGVAEGDRLKLLVANAQHQAVMQGRAQQRPRCLIERSIEIKTADRRRHRRRQPFAAQGDGTLLVTLLA
jgi:hypothetical protein